VSREEPTRVAIIGGGCAGITAAFELTRPEHEGKYEVTVYQQGFRLGGKGASGRGPAHRIEEHGLHLWMGFYENSFRVMRECYAELGRDPKQCRIATWQDAFAPDHYCGVMDRSPDGTWRPWTVHFPPMPGLPGDPDPRRWTVGDYLARTGSLLVTLLQAIRSKAEPAAVSDAVKQPPGPDVAAQMMSRWLRYGELATLTGMLQAVELLNNVVRNLPEYPRDLILRFHEQVAGAARAQLQARTEADDETRRLWEIVDLTLAAMRGIIRFGLLTDARGFEVIDGYDCREWLMLNGASERSVKSAFLRALYDLAFAYEDGDFSRPRIAAGQALRGALRAFFTYRGAFFWKMQAGMGDVVFAPFYEVLARRGVRFRFFHRLKNVGLAQPDAHGEDETPYVESLDFDVQAKVANGREYRPLIDVAGLPCWPSEPDWSQLVDGARLEAERWDFESHWDERRAERTVLRVGKDFDFVVLAVGLGAIPHVCSGLIERSRRWKDMVDRCKTVSTQAFQLWMNEDMTDLGWHDQPINVSGYVEPFDTWADMRQLIKEERFEQPVRSIAYFCNVLPDPPPGTDVTRKQYPGERRDETRASAVAFLNEHVGRLWPKAERANGGFRWEVLVPPGPADPSDASPADESRFASQFHTANVNPSDRYSLSLPGTLSYRISPLDRTFDNLTIAGDWTDAGFNEGCVEAAVMSGRLAAHAISQSPPLDEITGYDHP
jgi:uncharacterized protein with NAD-binding domain and iron-sulfur cluster